AGQPPGAAAHLFRTHGPRRLPPANGAPAASRRAPRLRRPVDRRAGLAVGAGLDVHRLTRAGGFQAGEQDLGDVTRGRRVGERRRLVAADAFEPVLVGVAATGGGGIDRLRDRWDVLAGVRTRGPVRERGTFVAGDREFAGGPMPPENGGARGVAPAGL